MFSSAQNAHDLTKVFMTEGLDEKCGLKENKCPNVCIFCFVIICEQKSWQNTKSHNVVMYFLWNLMITAK